MSTLSGSSGLPTRQSSCMKCSFMPWNKGGKRQNECATEVTKAASWNPIPRQISLPWSWWGIECLEKKYGMFTTAFISYGGAQGPPPVGHWEGEGLYRIYSPPYRPGYRGRPTLPKWRVQVPMGERGLELSHCNLMRWHYGLPTRKPWRLPRPSTMILRGSMTNVEKGHKPTARVGVDPGAIREVVLEAVPGAEPEPAAKALPMPIPKVCIPHLWMDNLVGEWVSANPGMNAQLWRRKICLQSP